MSEKELLQGKLVEILSSLQDAVGQAKDLAVEHVPGIAASYVAYGRAWHTLWAVLGTVMVVGGTLAAVIAVMREHKKVESMNGFLFFSGAASLVFGLILLVEQAKSAFMVWFAPNVWLLKEISEMLK